jgi:hypothetical protein
MADRRAAGREGKWEDQQVRQGEIPGAAHQVAEDKGLGLVERVVAEKSPAPRASAFQRSLQLTYWQASMKNEMTAATKEPEILGTVAARRQIVNHTETRSGGRFAGNALCAPSPGRRVGAVSPAGLASRHRPSGGPRQGRRAAERNGAERRPLGFSLIR